MKFHGCSSALSARLGALADSGRIPHATVLEGGSAEERSRLAHQLAQAVLCTAPAGRPCGQCSACRKVSRDAHPDLIEVGPESGRKTISVDVIRKMREDAYVLPNESDRKVYILEQAELMQEYAQNALLKILEEPPAYVTFILTCSSQTVLLPTVLSRATVFRIGTEQPEDDGGEQQKDVMEYARCLASAAASRKERKLLEAAAALDKDYDLLQPVLEQFTFIVRDALVLSAGGKSSISGAEKEARALSAAAGSEQLLAIIRTADDISHAVSLHANKNLTLTRLCSCLAADLASSSGPAV